MPGPAEDQTPPTLESPLESALRPYDQSNLANAAAALERLQHPKQIGPYFIRELIAEGGMGSVYKAEQRHPIERTVAVKVIKLGMDTREVIARFESERQALALMSHPNVARVLDAGATETGRPYFVMEYVAGLPITTFADQHRLTVRMRLELFGQACDAVQHAHQKAIIHRDLKPSNILVTTENDSPAVKVIDFGVAKALNRRLTERTLFTESGQLVGTPEYMAPEQADGRGAHDVDTRSDIYSLGVVLYELLIGALPFDPATLRLAGYSEIQRIIREVDPPRPSTRFSRLGQSATEVARLRRTQLGQLEQQLKSELEWIPLKAMRKEPSLRYSSAREMSEDIENYLAERPLRAGPESRAYRLRKFVRRNKRGVVASATMILLLIAGIITTTWQAIRAEHRRAEAEDAKAATAQVNTFLVDMFESVDPQFAQGKQVLVRDVLDKASKDIAAKLAGQPRVESTVRSALGRTYLALTMYDEANEHFIKALDIERAQNGDDHSQTLDAENQLGRLRRVQGRLEEARRIYQDTLARRRRVLGDNHVDTIGSINNLAVVMDRLGSPEAEAMYREARDRMKVAAGPDNEETLRFTGNLGQYLTRIGKYEESERLLRESYEGRRRTLGDDHPDTINISTRVASVMRHRGAWGEAESLMRDALQRCIRVFGEDHFSTILAENGLASLLTDQGKHEEGIARYLHAVEQARRVLGDEHIDTLGMMQAAAAGLSNAGRLAEAEALIREAVQGLLQTRGPDHPATIGASSNLVLILRRQERWGDALPLAKDLYERLREGGRVPMEPFRRALALCSYGVCLSQLGRHDEAIEPLTVGREALRQSGDTNSGALEDVLECLVDSSRALNLIEDAARWTAELDAANPSTSPATRRTPTTAR